MVGTAGAEWGIRGYIDAYDAATGKRRWRFYTVPTAGEQGIETWGGSSFKTGGGSTWITGTYDPELNLIYWGIGNPGPDMDGDVRPGDNLYTCAVVAIDADTGKLKWYFQFTPHDVHDWYAVADPVLVERRSTVRNQGSGTSQSQRVFLSAGSHQWKVHYSEGLYQSELGRRNRVGRTPNPDRQ